VPAPELAHDIVERDLPVRLFAQEQVEQEGDELALEVIGDTRVGCVLVLAVELDPGVEARFGQTLVAPARRALEGRDLPGENFQVALRRHEPGP
jgi:hypothetical protein